MPSVIDPCSASQPPNPITATWPRVGSASSVGFSRAVSRAARIRSANSRPAARSSAATSRASWPKPLTTRTPVTVSSTCWAMSAARCWADQVAGNRPARTFAVTRPATGSMTSATTVSSGDSQSIAATDDHHGGQVAGGQRHHRQQRLHQLQVGDRPGDDLAGAQRVLALPVQPLHRGEHLAAQVVLHVQGQPAGQVAAQERRAELDQRPARPGRRPPAQQRGRAGHRVVHGDLGQQRDDPPPAPTPSTETSSAPAATPRCRRQAPASRRIQPGGAGAGTTPR